MDCLTEKGVAKMLGLFAVQFNTVVSLGHVILRKGERRENYSCIRL